MIEIQPMRAKPRHSSTNESGELWLKDAMLVNGGNLERASFTDYAMHFITFGLKMFFASCPPPGKGGGWPCFVVSLFYIGLMVLIIR